MIYAAEPDSTALASEITNPIDRNNCTCKGIPLYGRVKVVTGLADFDVKVVNALSDIDVKIDDLPTRCGEWKFVDALEDFSIRFVDAFPGVR